jgi:type I restriction enzyme S subunit
VGTPVLRSNNIQNGKLFWGELVRVNVAVNERALVNEGDLLICARNGSPALVGKTALIPRLDEKAAFGAFMAIYRSRLNSYIYYFLCSPMFRTVIADVNTTTINQLHRQPSHCDTIAPLAEQHRIVAK